MSELTPKKRAVGSATAQPTPSTRMPAQAIALVIPTRERPSLDVVCFIIFSWGEASAGRVRGEFDDGEAAASLT